MRTYLEEGDEILVKNFVFVMREGQVVPANPPGSQSMFIYLDGDLPCRVFFDSEEGRFWYDPDNLSGPVTEVPKPEPEPEPEGLEPEEEALMLESLKHMKKAPPPVATGILAGHGFTTAPSERYDEF